MGGATRFLMLLTSYFPLLSARPSLFRLARHSRVIFPLHLTFSPSSPHRTFHFNSRRFHAPSASSALCDDNSFSSDQSVSVPGANTSHPWPQWSGLIHSLKRNGYFERIDYNFDDGFVNIGCLSSEFVTVSKACLQLAREKDNLLGLLSRRDVEVVVENGSAFLFRDAVGLKRRMELFLGTGESSMRFLINLVLESDKGSIVDLMKFLLCFANNHPPTSARNYQVNENDVELSVRNLLSQLVSLCFGAQESSFSGYMEKQPSDEYSQSTRLYGQRTEMKRGDWICPKCNFLNFARNMKCLECEESRPKRQLSGGEWECPQCDFFNYGKNVVCLRCDCKRPGEVSFNTTSGNLADKIDVNSRLAANEEKAQRWFSKVSQLDSASDVADEDFPEIMPLRKGVNRFIVSTRKTPLERRLANAQYRKNLGNDGIDEGHDQQVGGADNNIDARVSRTLDEILGRNSAVATDDKDSTSGQNAGIASSSRVSANSRGLFVPLPSDMFAKKREDSLTQENQKLVGDSSETVVSDNVIPTGPLSKSNVFGNAGDNFQLSEKPVNMTENKDKEKEEAEKAERWFKRVAELQDVSDLASEIPDEDFPDIMPMRKGENRFVVSKKKDRSLTSPMNKRRMAMEQATNTNFVPFVPFPPGYFAKKDDQNSEGADSSEASQTSASSVTVDKHPQESNQAPPKMEHQQSSSHPRNSRPSGESLPGRNPDTGYGAPSSGNRMWNTDNRQTFSNNPSSSAYSSMGRYASNTDNPIQNSTSFQGNASNTTSGYSEKENSSRTTNVRDGWTGKSLEGSAVKEPDPLDMSEEAKAERWFRRAAQIKDISELSQIPDEDFPSIMPMRKGVNRFVISKRKTPLERRLTSPQYRRSLPIVSSEPLKKENDSR